MLPKETNMLLYCQLTLASGSNTKQYTVCGGCMALDSESWHCEWWHRTLRANHVPTGDSWILVPKPRPAFQEVGIKEILGQVEAQDQHIRGWVMEPGKHLGMNTYPPSFPTTFLPLSFFLLIVLQCLLQLGKSNWRIQTCQYKCSTRSTLPQLQLENRNFVVHV